MTAGLFSRDIDGYIHHYSSEEVVNGVTYSIVRPHSTGKGSLEGVELAYTQFFDMLPGLDVEVGKRRPTYSLTERRPCLKVIGNLQTRAGAGQNLIVSFVDCRRFRSTIDYSCPLQCVASMAMDELRLFFLVRAVFAGL